MNIKKPDKTTLREQFEAERQRLAIEFAPPERSWWMSSQKITYKTTWEVANTPPHIQKDIDSLVVVNEKHSWIFMLSIIVFISFGFLGNIDFGEHVFFFFFSAVLLISILAQSIIHTADRSPKIIIDKEGIGICKWDLQVAWERIAETYIKESYNGEDTYYSLYIRYIDDEYVSFETTEIPIRGFMQGPIEIAYAIEYIKKNASDFQGHFS